MSKQIDYSALQFILDDLLSEFEELDSSSYIPEKFIETLTNIAKVSSELSDNTYELIDTLTEKGVYNGNE